MSTVSEVPEMKPSYPASLSVDYPEKLNRLTTFFRIFMIIPILIILGLITNAFVGSDEASKGWEWSYTSGGLLFVPLALMILFRKKYPAWWFNWNLELTRFAYRVAAYFVLLRDEYPSTDEEQAVHLDLVYPDAEKELMRGMPLIKWFLAIPHYIILFFLGIASWVCVIISWFAILFTSRYPKSLFDFVVGVARWGLRVEAYAFLLITDKYPPFTLEQ
jgi:hypothetical protein